MTYFEELKKRNELAQAGLASYEAKITHRDLTVFDIEKICCYYGLNYNYVNSTFSHYGSIYSTDGYFRHQSVVGIIEVVNSYPRTKLYSIVFFDGCRSVDVTHYLYELLYS